MNLISSGSISLDSTFNVNVTIYKCAYQKSMKNKIISNEIERGIFLLVYSISTGGQTSI